MIHSAKKEPNHLNGADGLRALACLGVIFHHLSQTLQVQQQTDAIQEMHSFMMMGSIGVSIFFVLSGYLLSYPFWRQYLQGGEFPSIRQYALRRAARIMPGYYIALAVGVIWVLASNIPVEHFWLRTLTGFTFTSGFHYITFFPSEMDGPLWSIGFEVFSYILMPLFMYGLFRWFRKKRSFPAALMYWAGVLLLIFAANVLIHRFFTPDDIMRSWNYGNIGGAKYWMPNYNPVGFFGHFAIGILASGVLVRLQQGKRTEAMRAKGLFDALSAASLLGAGLFIWLARHAPEFSLSFQNQPYFFPLLTVFFGGFLLFAPFSRWIGRGLDNPFFRYTAKVSFGLYIWHAMIITLVRMYWIKDFHFAGITTLNRWALISLGVIAASYAVASLSYFLIEKPILDLSKRYRPGSSGQKKTTRKKAA